MSTETKKKSKKLPIITGLLIIAVGIILICFVFKGYNLKNNEIILYDNLASEETMEIMEAMENSSNIGYLFKYKTDKEKAVLTLREKTKDGWKTREVKNLDVNKEGYLYVLANDPVRVRTNGKTIKEKGGETLLENQVRFNTKIPFKGIASYAVCEEAISFEEDESLEELDCEKDNGIILWNRDTGSRVDVSLEKMADKGDHVLFLRFE